MKKVEAARAVALAAGSVDLSISGVQILTDLTLEIEKGEFLAVIGPNGAGKTTLVNVLSGAQAPTNGTVSLLGTDVTKWKSNKRAGAGLARTFQTSSLFDGLTVYENVRLARSAVHWKWKDSIKKVAASEERILAEIERVGLSEKIDETAGNLSHGDARKLEIAMVLAQDPSVILLDEPMAGVNTNDVPALVELIKKVREDVGVTVLMVEHHLQVVLDLADRIAVMHHGKLLSIGTPEEVMADETVQKAYVGEQL